MHGARNVIISWARTLKDHEGQPGWPQNKDASWYDHRTTSICQFASIRMARCRCHPISPRRANVICACIFVHQSRESNCAPSRGWPNESRIGYVSQCLSWLPMMRDREHSCQLRVSNSPKDLQFLVPERWFTTVLNCYLNGLALLESIFLKCSIYYKWRDGFFSKFSIELLKSARMEKIEVFVK